MESIDLELDSDLTLYDQSATVNMRSSFGDSDVLHEGMLVPLLFSTSLMHMKPHYCWFLVRLKSTAFILAAVVFLYYLKSIVAGADIVIKVYKFSWQMLVWSIVASVEQTCDLHICRFDICLHLAWAAHFSTLDIVIVCYAYKLIIYVLFCLVSARNWWKHFLYAICVSSANHRCP